MSENQYDGSVHDVPLFCQQDGCGVKNAPVDSEAYDSNCWRCGEDLHSGTVSTGDVLEVSMIDETDDGRPISKAPCGIVVFVQESVDKAEFHVEITDVERSHAYGIPTEPPASTEEESDSETEQPQRLGSRDNFWESE